MLRIVLFLATFAFSRPPFDMKPSATSGTALVLSATATYIRATTTTGTGRILIDAGPKGAHDRRFSGSDFTHQGDTVYFSVNLPSDRGASVTMKLFWTEFGATDSITYVTTGETHNANPDLSWGAIYYDFRELIPLSISSVRPHHVVGAWKSFDPLGRDPSKSPREALIFRR